MLLVSGVCSTKLQLSDNSGYKVFAELIPPSVEGMDKITVRFTTQYDGAKEPEEEQVKFEMALTVDELARFKNFL